VQQAAMEKVAASGEDHDRQRLRPRPRKNVGERHHVVLLAVNHDRVGGDGADREATDGGTCEHQALRFHRLRDDRLHVGSERKPREHDGQRAARLVEAGARERKRGERIRGLPAAFVELAFRTADASEIEADRGVAQREERLGERLRDLVVEGAALQRMRMCDESDSARRRFGDVLRDFERTCRARDRRALGRLRRQMRSLSTISPFITWRSMISSMSARST
jgi:hypothetical protein